MTVREAVVLAAGEGQRLRPLTRHRPKPMLPAANRPILEYVLDTLVDVGVDRIHVVVGYKRSRVQEHFGPSYRDVPLHYVSQDKQLGSGHALLQARDAVDGPCLVLNGDQIVAADIVEDVLAAFEADADAVGALGVLERDELAQYGAIELDDGRVVNLVEKPDAGAYRLLNAGVYAFDPAVFDAIEATPRVDGELSLTDTITRLVDDDRVVRGVRTAGLWMDATYPWDLLAVAGDLLAAGWIEDDERGDGVWVADSAQVHDTAVLQAPVVVGADSVVGPGAVVGSHTALGRNVTVGANAVVEASVVEDDARIDAGSTVRECVAGQGVSLGAGSVVAGGRADVVIAGEVHERQRLGAVLADRVHVEGGVTFAPGTLVGPNARIESGCQVRGRIEADAVVVR
ncbi:bifunctional sugar-1-phosphate nucleotidylyltransferase/acetyltransferase [Halobacteriaceae archaeon GCM10025711]